MLACSLDEHSKVNGTPWRSCVTIKISKLVPTFLELLRIGGDVSGSLGLPLVGRMSC